MQNYVEVFQSKAFRLATFNTLCFIGVGVPLLMAFSLGLSLLLQKNFSGVSTFRAVFLFPLIVPIASTVMVFDIFFSDAGVLNKILQLLGMSPVSFLNGNAAFWILVGLYIWKNSGYNMVLFLAALNGIPNSIYEAARMDGATKGQLFTKITVPLMIPSLFFVLIISIINSFKSFREAYLIGGTMPHSSIYMLQHFMNNNFSNLNYQRLSVAAIMIFTVIVTLIYILFRLERRAGDV